MISIKEMLSKLLLRIVYYVKLRNSAMQNLNGNIV